MSKYLLMITLNVNGLNAPIKRHRVAEWIKNMTGTYAASKRRTSKKKTLQNINSPFLPGCVLKVFP